jgi:hypothetical protein
MDDATMNKLYGWKGRVHKAIKVFEQCKMEYVRVCALPKTKGALLKSMRTTTCNHDADIALTWVLLESSRKIVDATCDGYIASIRRSFYAYRKQQEEMSLRPPPTAPTTDNETNNTPTITIWIEGIVENTINSHVRFIEQWRDIISDAQKEVTGWKSEHEKYLDKMCEVEEARKKQEQGSDACRGDEEEHSADGDNVDSDNADKKDDSEHEDESEHDVGVEENNNDDDGDGDSIHEQGNDRIELLRMGMRVDEHAARLFQMGTYVSAGKVLISSLKIANKIESIETAAQEAGTACILGLTQLNLRDRDVVLSNFNHVTNHGADGNGEPADCNKSVCEIVEEWKQQSDTTKLNAIYSWYRMYHGALSVNTKHL